MNTGAGRPAGPTAVEPAWRRRFRAARVSLPGWARDDPARCLYASNAGGKWELYAWDRRAGTHRQATDRAEGTVRGTLDPTGARIWWFDDDRGSEFGVWVTQPFAGGAPPEPAVPGLEPAYGAGLALGSGAAAVGRSVGEVTTVHVVRPGMRSELVYEHRQDAGVGGLSRDERYLSLHHSEHGDSRHPDLRVVDLEGAAVAELSDGPGRGVGLSRWAPVPGDARLLVLHERRDLPRPMVWSPLDGTETELDLDLPGEVSADWYPDAASLLLTHDHRGRTELYRYDLATGSLERIPTEPGTVGAARVRPDGELWYSWTSAATAPEVRSGGEVLLRPPGEAAPSGVAYVDLDVEGIHGFVARPEGEPPFPTVFLVHGGPASHDLDAFAPEPQAWVDHGYAVVLVNYRGSTGYGRAWRDALEGNPGLTELDDLAKVHGWAVSTGLADPSRMVLAGHSWGGYLTLLGLGLQPERWSLGIAGVPVADYVAAYEDEMDGLKAFDRALFGGTPDDIPDEYRRRSPITYVEQVRAPLMILAGEHDPRCPIRQIENYVARLEALDRPHEVYRFDAGHGSLVMEERIRQVAAMIGFATRSLETRPVLE